MLGTARLEGVPHGSRALLDSRRTIGAEIMRALVNVGGDEASDGVEVALLAARDEARSAPVGDHVESLRKFHGF